MSKLAQTPAADRINEYCALLDTAIESYAAEAVDSVSLSVPGQYLHASTYYSDPDTFRQRIFTLVGALAKPHHEATHELSEKYGEPFTFAVDSDGCPGGKVMLPILDDINDPAAFAEVFVGTLTIAQQAIKEHGCQILSVSPRGSLMDDDQTAAVGWAIDFCVKGIADAPLTQVSGDHDVSNYINGLASQGHTHRPQLHGLESLLASLEGRG